MRRASEFAHASRRRHDPRDGSVLRSPGRRERLEGEDRSYRLLGELPDLEVVDAVFEPGWEGVDPHVHDDHTDSFYVLEGEVEFLVNGEWRRGGPDNSSRRRRESNTVSGSPASTQSACSTYTHRTFASSPECECAKDARHRPRRLARATRRASPPPSAPASTHRWPLQASSAIDVLAMTTPPHRRHARRRGASPRSILNAHRAPVATGLLDTVTDQTPCTAGLRARGSPMPPGRRWRRSPASWSRSQPMWRRRSGGRATRKTPPVPGPVRA